MTIKQQKMYIDGQFVDHRGDKWIEVLNPSTEEVISRVPDAGVEDVRSAIDAAERAQEAWEELPAQERGVWLHKIAAGIRAREKALTDIIIAEGGKTRALPSGRVVCYPGAAIVKGDVTYMGTNPYSRKWDRLKTYGGRLVENITQAAARDVLAAAMPVIEEHDYEIVLTVHDEVVCEAPDTDDYTHDALSTLLATPPPWADGLPLNAGGFEAPYYRKD